MVAALLINMDIFFGLTLTHTRTHTHTHTFTQRFPLGDPQPDSGNLKETGG